MKNDGGPAFPGISEIEDDSGHIMRWNKSGMTLRQYYAAKAPKMPQWWVKLKRNKETYNDPHNDHGRKSELQWICQWSFDYADAMIRHEENEK